jgi:hypothetical protein
MRCIACKLCNKAGSVPAFKDLDKIPVNIRAESRELYPTMGMDIGMAKSPECPLCGTSARKRFNIPTFVTQKGWTTAEGVNTYYTILATEEAKYLAEKEITRRRANKEIASNSQEKKLHRVLVDNVKTVLLNTKYKKMMEKVDDE